MFQHLSYIGTTHPAHTIRFDFKRKSHRHPVPLTQWLKKHNEYSRLQEMATYYYGTPQRDNIEKSLLYRDYPLTDPMQDPKYGESFKLAYVYVAKTLAPVLTARPMTGSVPMPANTSGGVVAKRLGFASKAAYMISPHFAQGVKELNKQTFETSHKVELAPLESILQDRKCRTFDIPCAELALAQRIVYGNQDVNLQEAGKNPKFPIRYGFSKENGGFHRLGKMIQANHVRDEGDGSKYDKGILLQPHVYAMRNMFLDMSDHPNLIPVRDWVKDSVVHFCFLDADGHIWQSNGGNPSGNSCTTSDNSISHLIIRYTITIEQLKALNIEPTYERVLLPDENLYGDDTLCGKNKRLFVLDEKGEPDLELYKQLSREVYKVAGVTLKPTAHKVHFSPDLAPVVGMEFLGSTLAWDSATQLYYPIPRLNKVITSLLYCEKGMTMELYAQRVCGLLYVSFAVPWLRSVLLDIITHMLDEHRDVLSEPTLRTMSCLKQDSSMPETLFYGFE